MIVANTINVNVESRCCPSITLNFFSPLFYTTGETITRAVTEALKERYERLRNRQDKASVAELLAIARRSASHVRGVYVDHAEFLYDEHGLPK